MSNTSLFSVSKTRKLPEPPPFSTHEYELVISIQDDLELTKKDKQLEESLFSLEKVKLKEYDGKPLSVKPTILYNVPEKAFHQSFVPHLLLYFVRIEDEDKYKLFYKQHLKNWIDQRKKENQKWIVVYCPQITKGFAKSEDHRRFRNIFSRFTADLHDKVVKLDCSLSPADFQDEQQTFRKVLTKRIGKIFDSRYRDIKSYERSLSSTSPEQSKIAVQFEYATLYEQYGLFQQASDIIRDIYQNTSLTIFPKPQLNAFDVGNDKVTPFSTSFVPDFLQLLKTASMNSFYFTVYVSFRQFRLYAAVSDYPSIVNDLVPSVLHIMASIKPKPHHIFVEAWKYAAFTDAFHFLDKLSQRVPPAQMDWRFSLQDIAGQALLQARRSLVGIGTELGYDDPFRLIEMTNQKQESREVFKDSFARSSLSMRRSNSSAALELGRRVSRVEENAASPSAMSSCVEETTSPVEQRASMKPIPPPPVNNTRRASPLRQSTITNVDDEDAEAHPLGQSPSARRLTIQSLTRSNSEKRFSPLEKKPLAKYKIIMLILQSNRLLSPRIILSKVEDATPVVEITCVPLVNGLKGPIDYLKEFQRLTEEVIGVFSIPSRERTPNLLHEQIADIYFAQNQMEMAESTYKTVGMMYRQAGWIELQNAISLKLGTCQKNQNHHTEYVKHHLSLLSLMHSKSASAESAPVLISELCHTARDKLTEVTSLDMGELFSPAFTFAENNAYFYGHTAIVTMNVKNPFTATFDTDNEKLVNPLERRRWTITHQLPRGLSSGNTALNFHIRGMPNGRFRVERMTFEIGFLSLYTNFRTTTKEMEKYIFTITITPPNCHLILSTPGHLFTTPLPPSQTDASDAHEGGVLPLADVPNAIQPLIVSLYTGADQIESGTLSIKQDPHNPILLRFHKSFPSSILLPNVPTYSRLRWIIPFWTERKKETSDQDMLCLPNEVELSLEMKYRTKKHADYSVTLPSTLTLNSPISVTSTIHTLPTPVASSSQTPFRPSSLVCIFIRSTAQVPLTLTSPRLVPLTHPRHSFTVTPFAPSSPSLIIYPTQSISFLYTLSSTATSDSTDSPEEQANDDPFFSANFFCDVQFSYVSYFQREEQKRVNEIEKKLTELQMEDSTKETRQDNVSTVKPKSYPFTRKTKTDVPATPSKPQHFATQMRMTMPNRATSFAVPRGQSPKDLLRRSEMMSLAETARGRQELLNRCSTVGNGSSIEMGQEAKDEIASEQIRRKFEQTLSGAGVDVDEVDETDAEQFEQPLFKDGMQSHIPTVSQVISINHFVSLPLPPHFNILPPAVTPTLTSLPSLGPPIWLASAVSHPEHVSASVPFQFEIRLAAISTPDRSIPQRKQGSERTFVSVRVTVTIDHSVFVYVGMRASTVWLELDAPPVLLRSSLTALVPSPTIPAPVVSFEMLDTRQEESSGGEMGDPVEPEVWCKEGSIVSPFGGTTLRVASPSEGVLSLFPTLSIPANTALPFVGAQSSAASSSTKGGGYSVTFSKI
ncbi:putative trafficking protein particle complex subunit 10 [Blattamonas nauphoetae]|uniref:Trafficking protein particle complex subunit 10 n=1 Tax=Blattamonas nauphoetae TaxID=2049346 RepID=A0ABQ9X859_9EUKA|nr:putative trafficking protein particle complex subunit 10 [Blattamonas nauphoetae]